MRRPVPPALRAVHGLSPIDDFLPMIPGDTPPPDRLSPVAAEVWNELLPLLQEIPLVARQDKIALELLCEAYADWVEAKMVLANPDTPRYERASNDDGREYWIKHPAVADLSDADRRLRGWLQEFGLSPAMRGKNTKTWPDGSLMMPSTTSDLDLSQMTNHEQEMIRQLVQRRQEMASKVIEAETVE